MNKSNVITFLIISSIILLAACTDQATQPSKEYGINTLEVANVATMQGVQASNKCIQAATDTLNGIHQRDGIDTEYTTCSREVVKAWLEKDIY